MNEQTITISMERLETLMNKQASINALQAYVKAERYPNRKIMCDIVGVEYEEED